MALVKKTYLISKNEADLLYKMKDDALSKKYATHNSHLIRVGIHLASLLPTDKLIKMIKETIG